ncbi:hypothetical protein GCM10027517_13510 [Phycicoccus ginsengisoli]
MSYDDESEAWHARRARRRRALITLGVVALMLFFAFWYAYSYFRADGQRTAAPRPSCPTAAAASTALKPADITLNVYNATTRDGLAKKTASEVRKRGFLVATVSNDPLQRTVRGPAEVRYGPTGKKGAPLVLALVKGAKGVQDARNDSSVDLVLGNTYKALAPPPKQAPATGSTTKSGATTTRGTATPSTGC